LDDALLRLPGNANCEEKEISMDTDTMSFYFEFHLGALETSVATPAAPFSISRTPFEAMTGRRPPSS
jgi:hypothetical protein